MDPEKKSLNFIFPTKYVIPKSLKFSHWPSKLPPKKSNTTPPKPIGKAVDTTITSWILGGALLPFFLRVVCFSGKNGDFKPTFLLAEKYYGNSYQVTTLNRRKRVMPLVVS